MKRALVLLMAAALMLGGCGKVRDEGYKSSLSEEDALKELKSLITKVDVREKSNPILDIYTDETSEADNLADIDRY